MAFWAKSLELRIVATPKNDARETLVQAMTTSKSLAQSRDTARSLRTNLVQNLLEEGQIKQAVVYADRVRMAYAEAHTAKDDVLVYVRRSAAEAKFDLYKLAWYQGEVAESVRGRGCAPSDESDAAGNHAISRSLARSVLLSGPGPASHLARPIWRGRRLLTQSEGLFAKSGNNGPRPILDANREGGC